MTALATARMIEAPSIIETLDANVAANAVIYKGALCGFKAGYLVNWVDSDPDIKHPCIAMPELSNVVDNTGGADGDLTCPIKFIRPKYCYRFANDGAPNAIAQAHIGGDAWGKDDQTVSASSSSGTRSRVGTPWKIVTTNARGYPLGVYVEPEGSGDNGALLAVLGSTAAGDGASLIAIQDSATRITATNIETALAEIAGRIFGAVADAAALQAVTAAQRVNGMIVVKLDDDTIWTFDSGSAAGASDWVIVPSAGTGRWLRNHVSLTDLSSNANGKGAALIGVEDAGAFTANTTVEAVLAEILQHLKSTQASIPLSLMQFREVDANGDVGNIVANGGILASDTTPIMRADAAESHEISWAAGNSDIISAQVALPADFDGTANASVDLFVYTDNGGGGGIDAATFTVETSWDGGALVTDTATDGTPATTHHKITATIAAADIPDAPSYVTIHLTPAAHAADPVQLVAARLNYKSKLLTS